MKIAFLTPFFYQNRGNSTTAKRIISGLKMAGIDVTIFAYEEEDWTEEKYHSIQQSNLLHILHISRFVKWQQKQKFSITKPYILTNGGTDVNHDLFNVRQDDVYKKFIEQANDITVFTEDGAKKLSSVFHHSNISIIPQSVWFPEGKLKEIENLKTGHLNILLPAGLRRVKDLFFVLDEIVLLRSIYSDLHLIIAGIIIEADVYEELCQYQQKYPWIIFCHDVPFDEMKSLYLWADVVLNTSISEGQALAILEAMEMGCLVVARRNGGNESIIMDEQNGILFETPDEFFEKMVMILQDSYKQKELKEKAYHYIHLHHRLENEINSYISLYKKVLKQ